MQSGTIGSVRRAWAKPARVIVTTKKAGTRTTVSPHTLAKSRIARNNLMSVLFTQTLLITNAALPLIFGHEQPGGQGFEWWKIIAIARY